MEKHKIIGEMYGVLLLIEEEYKDLIIREDFNDYVDRRSKELLDQAREWRADDERERSETSGDE